MSQLTVNAPSVNVNVNVAPVAAAERPKLDPARVMAEWLVADSPDTLDRVCQMRGYYESENSVILMLAEELPGLAQAMLRKLPSSYELGRAARFLFDYCDELLAWCSVAREVCELFSPDDQDRMEAEEAEELIDRERTMALEPCELYDPAEV
jgi:hypothetical protein